MRKVGDQHKCREQRKTNKAKQDAPVKVHYSGYTNASDEWVGADRLRSKHLKKKEQSATKKFGMPAVARKLLLVKPKVIAPLDKGFAPLVLAKKAYLEAA